MPIPLDGGRGLWPMDSLTGNIVGRVGIVTILPGLNLLIAAQEDGPKDAEGGSELCWTTKVKTVARKHIK